MFKKILIANRGDNKSAAIVATKSNHMVREAHAGEFAAETTNV